jgi:hypothetical protein
MSSDPVAQPAVKENGRTLADHLVDWYLALPDVEQMTPMQAWVYRLLKPLMDIGEVTGNALVCVSKLPPSAGYEPLLVESGYNRILARAAAGLVVRSAKRSAKESKRRRPVFDAIRFLAERGRRRRATLARAKLLLAAWEETSIIETIFDEAGVSAFEFIRLLKSVLEGGAVESGRLTEIAAAVAPHLSLAPGPKVSVPSAAHEIFLEEFGGLLKRRRAYSWRDRAKEYTDAVTQATRREFNVSHFDKRSVRRRLARRRLNGQKHAGNS